MYLAGLLHDKKLKKYDKVALLKSTKTKVEKRIEVLEEAQKKEKDPQLKAEIGKRLKDAKATKNYCEKQLFKVAKAKGEVRDRSKDDFDFDLGDDFDFDDDFDDWSLDESTEIIDESVVGSLKVKIHDIINKGKSKDEIIRKVKEIVYQDANRHIVVASAPGKRNGEDIKININSAIWQKLRV